LLGQEWQLFHIPLASMRGEQLGETRPAGQPAMAAAQCHVEGAKVLAERGRNRTGILGRPFATPGVIVVAPPKNLRFG
jgi:hypothetical protein